MEARFTGGFHVAAPRHPRHPKEAIEPEPIKIFLDSSEKGDKIYTIKL
jgi:hypothetical protein